ncbi:MAG TPA: thioesterase family protein [Nevskiaceae bacterium]|nr:thioesterase family protein [Nevskiaceae bacterium]
MKPDPARLEPATYPFAIELQTRFGDLDVLGHLNNAAIARLYEEGRSRFGMAKLADLRDPSTGRRTWWALVANVNISYLGEAHYPAPVTIGVGIGRLGGSSYTIAHGMFQEGRCVGVCDCTLVIVSRETRKAMALPGDLRERLGAFLVAGARNQTS